MNLTTTLSLCGAAIYCILVGACYLTKREPHLGTVEWLADMLDHFAGWFVRVAAFLRAGADQYRAMKQRERDDINGVLERMERQ